ncbi:MAG TPA: serine hydrolase [Mucilaginibacter sp.]|jgi:CubicO group peptidase (beta-lactamase class C family)
MKKLFLVCLCGITLNLTVLAQKNYTPAFDKYMQAQVAVNGFSGVVMVADKGIPIYEKAFGYADREWKLPNTLETKFEIGSLTKQFTAAAILQLVEQGKLSLDDKLTAYFPGYPNGDMITLHMLLNHTSGIADYTGLPAFYPRHTLALQRDSVIALFKNQPLAFAPGTKWSYSNSNYFLLGCIIEKVTKKPYDTWLYENVIKKASIKNTAINRIDSILAFRARGYSMSKKGEWRNTGYFSMEFPFSAGAIISTAEDLYKWQNALFDGKIISAQMVTKMTSPYKGSYGYGLRIDTFAHHLRVSHSGGIPGFSSFMSRFPSDGLTIIVLSNDEGNCNAIADAIANTIFDLPVDLPYKPTEVTINTKVLERYLGKYQLGGTTNFELIEKENKLYLKPQGGPEMELKPESETKFFLAREPKQQIEFILDKSGEITKYSFINNGSRIEIKRLN